MDRRHRHSEREGSLYRKWSHPCIEALVENAAAIYIEGIEGAEQKKREALPVELFSVAGDMLAPTVAR